MSLLLAGRHRLLPWPPGVAGTPFVGPRSGAFPELAQATGGMALFEPGSSADLARVLRDLAADAPRRSEMGRQGQRAVREKFSAAAMARRVLTVLEGIAGRPAEQVQAGSTDPP